MAAETPAYWDVAAAVKACRIVQWSGDVWRCHSRKWAAESAVGSLIFTGRFNRGRDKFPDHETWQALYTSLAQHVALGERIRHTTWL
jgi:RES domain-containing protein